MEPRFDNRGNAAVGRLTERRQLASMEPRFDNRGNYSLNAGTAPFTMLQWSRGSITAETQKRDALRKAIEGLQWSRGSITAETRNCAPLGIWSPRFNGAAVR